MSLCPWMVPITHRVCLAPWEQDFQSGDTRQLAALSCFKPRYHTGVADLLTACSQFHWCLIYLK